jgi:hypothetical protein
MGDDLGDLLRLDAIIERAVEIKRQLDGLAPRDQGGERDNAAITH